MRYISYSELDTYYRRGANVYFTTYILGIATPPTPAMKFGKIVHKMLEDESYDYKAALSGELESKLKVADKIKNNVPRPEASELEINVDINGLPLYARIDGFSDGHLIEYKTGSRIWTPDQVQLNEQITHYTLVYYLKYQQHLPFKLISINSNNGNYAVFDTSRTLGQLDNWLGKLRKFKFELENLGWWEKKLAQEDRLKLNPIDETKERKPALGDVL